MLQTPTLLLCMCVNPHLCFLVNSLRQRPFSLVFSFIHNIYIKAGQNKN